MHISPNITRAFNTTVLRIRKNSPAILIGISVVSGIAATGTAIHSTLKVEDILEQHRETIKKIERTKHIVDTEPDVEAEYTDDMVKADKRTTTIQTGLKIAKLYLPTMVLSVTSVTCALAAHNIMSKRNAAVTAAFTALSSKFEDYRDMVRGRLGDDVERDIYKRIIEEADLDEDGDPNGDIHKKHSDKIANIRLF